MKLRRGSQQNAPHDIEKEPRSHEPTQGDGGSHQRCEIAARTLRLGRLLLEARGAENALVMFSDALAAEIEPARWAARDGLAADVIVTTLLLKPGSHDVAVAA